MKKRSLMVALAATTMLMLSACSTPATSSDDGAPDPDNPTKITVGVIPIVDTAPIWLGVEKGFFSEVGLDVTVQPTTGGAASVPGVVAGSYDFAFGNYVSGMVANDQGLNLRYVANGNSTAGSPDFGAVVVNADSDITRPADLAGKTVSVNNLQNIGDTTIRTVVDDDGGDSSAIKFVEVAFPDAEAALVNHQVDAAWILAPFLDSAVANGARVITYNFSDFDPGLDIAGYFTTADTVANKPGLVKAFQAAMDKSLEYADSHPDEVKQIVTTYTKMTLDQLNAMVLPKFNVDFNRAALEKLGAAAAGYGTLAKAPDLDTLLPKP
jgi:NitT/TauT family transport system substrate-binding protein